MGKSGEATFHILDDPAIRSCKHLMEVRPSSFICSCGVEQGTITGAQAMRKAYEHGMKCIPFIIHISDIRHCSPECRKMDREVFGQHHKKCFNYKEEL